MSRVATSSKFGEKRLEGGVDVAPSGSFPQNGAAGFASACIMLVCPLISGSSGNATYVESGSARVLVDCGGTGAQIEKALRAVCADPQKLTGLLVTHSHDDHVRGLGVFSRRYNLPIFASVGTWDELLKRDKIGRVDSKNIRVFQSARTDEPLDFGDLSASFFSTPHDAYDSVGFVLSDGRRSFGIATDFGRVTPGIRAALLGCDGVLLEANYDADMLWKGPYPYPLKTRIASAQGHLSNEDAGSFAIELIRGGTKTIFLGHLSEHNNTQPIAYRAVDAAVVGADDALRKECMIYMTRRYEPSRVVNL